MHELRPQGGVLSAAGCTRTLRPGQVMRSLATAVFMSLTMTSAARAAAPPDFDLVAAGGSKSPGSSYAWIHIDASGHAEFAVNRADTLTAAPLDTMAFTLTGGQLDTLWQQIQNQGFFSLLPNYENTAAIDGAITRITVTGNAANWTVNTLNTDVAAMDSIVAEINQLTPGEHDLVCAYSAPDEYTPQDGCGNTAPALAGKPWSAPSRSPAGSEASCSARRPMIPAGGWGSLLTDPGHTRLAAQHADAARRREQPGAVTIVDAPHPGTTVAYHMPLENALSRGIATVTAKGPYFGDAASLTVNNSSSVTTDDLQTDLYLDLYGPAAAGSGGDVEGVIEAAWNGRMTSSGHDMGVNVTEQFGGSAPPGAMGFHQILIGNQKTNPQVGRPYVSPMGTVNQGQVGGRWNNIPPIASYIQSYGHEAGHLMGLPDRYITYNKNGDSSWIATSGGNASSPCAAGFVGSTRTTSQLAPYLLPRFPALTLSQINELLNKPSIIWSTIPCPGSENDIMATAFGEPLQADVDAIAAQAGLVVDVPPGTVLMSKDPSKQNLLTLRESHVLVLPGQVRTIFGLWAACIDPGKQPPDAGAGFDVAPPLSQWTGNPSAVAMQTLLDYVNRNGLFCDTDTTTLAAIWDLAEGWPPTPGDSALFAAAGIPLPLPAGFPNLTDPYTGPDTRNVVPLELFRPLLALNTGDIISPGQPVGLAGSPVGVSEPGLSTSLAWTLVPPTGSTSSLSAATGTTSGFQSDVRGSYRIGLHETVTTPTDTFTVDSLRDVMAADAYTETFESGSIRAGAPFNWVTSGASGWMVYSNLRHTGSFCIMAPSNFSSLSSTISTTVTLSAPGVLQFSYIVGISSVGSELRFLVDGTLAAAYGNTPHWQTATITIPAGTHTLTWNLYRTALAIDVAAIDDIVFPPTAHLTGIPSTPPATTPVASFGPFHPNPAVAETFIPFTIPRATHVRLSVYDLLGRRVARLADDDLPAGAHEVRLDASRLAPGLYSVRIEAAGLRATRSLVHLR